jgi:hypothetical protein
MGKTKINFKMSQLFSFIKDEFDQKIEGYDRVVLGIEMIRINDKENFEVHDDIVSSISDDDENATYVLTGSDTDITKTIIAVCEKDEKIRKSIITTAMYFEAIRNKELEKELKEKSLWEKLKRIIRYGKKEKK